MFCQSVHPSVCPSICPSIYLFVPQALNPSGMGPHALAAEARTPQLRKTHAKVHQDRALFDILPVRQNKLQQFVMEMSKRHLKQWDKQTYGQIEVLDQRVTEIKTHVLKKKNIDSSTTVVIVCLVLFSLAAFTITYVDVFSLAQVVDVKRKTLQLALQFSFHQSFCQLCRKTDDTDKCWRKS